MKPGLSHRRLKAGNVLAKTRARAMAAAAFAALVATLAGGPAEAEEVRSPDGRIAVTVAVDDRGSPRYAVSYDDAPVVRASRLGLRFRAEPDFDRGLEIVDAKTAGHASLWEQSWGERRRVEDRHNELLVSLHATDSAERTLRLRVRVFDDGFGFRYEVPAQPGFDRIDIVDELTEFHLPEGATAWWIPAGGWNRYEYTYRTSGLDAIETAHTPMTMRLADGTHLSIHEAALTDYAGFSLQQRRPNVFKTVLAPWSDGVRVKTAAPFVTPWRTVQIARDAVGLLNSSLILNLNEPNVLGDVSWVEPGKYVGIWWAMHLGQRTWGSGPAHGATTDETKRYIDFASRNGFDGVLVEGWNVGWDGDWFDNGAIFSFTEAYDDFDLREVAEYALAKGVRLVGHHETSGHVTNYERQLGDAFDLYERRGVRQVKTGYVADGGQIERVDEDGKTHFEWHDGQFAVEHFRRVLEEAAKRRISINTHEPVKDTGLRRTYPNWLSREGARGQEYNASWSEPNPPEHVVILPYTRLLAGPMDYTPGIFDLEHQGKRAGRRVPSTLAQQLALYVVLYSPIQMAADLPENYLERPDAFRFIRDVPTDWEESIALAGSVGDYVVFARRERGGDDWYLGAATDEDARELSIPLAFLDAGSTYGAEIYRDADDADWRDNPYALDIERKQLSRDDALVLRLAAGGGAAVRFAAAD